MKTSKIKLAEEMLKNSMSFKLNQINYELQKETLVIWSANTNKGTLHNLELVIMFKELFSCYASYNEDKKRVELNVF